MKNIIILAMIILSFSLPFNASAARWRVDYAHSHIGFSGTHAGNVFHGTFGAWLANIDFDSASPETSTVRTVIDLSSAATGNATYDATLPQAEWLDSTTQKQAVWQSTAIRRVGDNHYQADGTLTLRGKTVPVALDFTLEQGTDGTTTMHATPTLKRMDFGIGASSDAAGEWVSLDIGLDITIVAKPAP